MRILRMACMAGLLALSGCSEEPADMTQDAPSNLSADMMEEAPSNQFGFKEAMEPTIFGSAAIDRATVQGEAQRAAAAVSSTPAPDAPAPVTSRAARQIAYSYAWGFRVDADNLPLLQQRHRALCESMGEDCRMLNMSQSGGDDFAYGEVNLQVVASKADEFGDQLAASAAGVDAEQVSFALSGEDLTDQITDVEAHLAGRRLLRDRLMEVLRNRQGSVADLVAAERGVAEVNEEIDAAAARLATMRNSVTFSDVTINYDPHLGQGRIGFSRPIMDALGNAGSTLGVVVSALIYLFVALIPITAVLLALRWLLHRFGLRLRFWRNSRTHVEQGL